MAVLKRSYEDQERLIAALQGCRRDDQEIIERLREVNDILHREVEEMDATNAREHAEVERLREALQYIADWQLGEAMAARLMRDHARSVLDG